MRVVSRLGELADGESKTFDLDLDGRAVECFLVRWRGEHRAYLNRCRHVAMTMDWIENRFFDREKRFLLCPTHGGCYEPDTGECVSGPPAGKRLVSIPLEIDGDEILARLPDDLAELRALL